MSLKPLPYRIHKTMAQCNVAFLPVSLSNAEGVERDKTERYCDVFVLHHKQQMINQKNFEHTFPSVCQSRGLASYNSIFSLRSFLILDYCLDIFGIFSKTQRIVSIVLRQSLVLLIIWKKYALSDLVS